LSNEKEESIEIMSDRVKQHRECYGGLLPDFEHLNHNKPTEGRAFRVFVENIGAGRQRRDQEVKAEAWDECVACADYRPCYELSMAKLALHRALARC
jgi:hypothetical protein